MTDLGPYSRVYWTVLDDKKFDAIRADMRHFGSWTLMLVLADMAYPAPTFIPPTIPKASLAALVDAKLIELLPARMYRVKGLPKERERRSERGRTGAAARWSGIADGMRTHSEGNATGMRDETRRDETRQGIDEDEQRARPLGPSDDETTVLVAIANAGASIRPESPMGQRVIRLVARRGAEGVLTELAQLVADAAGDALSDRQIVFGLEDRLDPKVGRVPATAAVTEGPSPHDIRMQRAQEKAAASRLEYFSVTGKWDPAFGPEPEWNPEWGERPAKSKVAA